MSDRKISAEVDEDLLAAVQKVLSTMTIKDTIEEAFREVLRVEARREEVQALCTMQEMELTDPYVMSTGWRR